MARKSFSNQPVEAEKIDIPEAPEEKKAASEPKKAKKKVYKIQITAGSVIIHSVRYEGIQLWEEGDIRLEAAKGDFKILEIIER